MQTNESIKLKELLAIFILSVLVWFGIVKYDSIFLGERINLRERAYVAAEKETPAINVPGPDLSAEAYLIKIIGNDYPLLKKRETKLLAPASLTKILSAVITLENLPKENWVKFSKDAKKNTESGEKMSGVSENDSLRADDSIRLSLIMSANDAVLALAEAVGEKLGGKSFEENLFIFSYLMNEKVSLIGMKNSFFENPTGLDSDSHLSTAEDLAKLAEYIWYHYPSIWDISRTIETDIVSKNSSIYTIKNTNELLKEYPALLGGKTGFTDNARGALILLYPVKPEKTAIIIILKSEDRFGDGRKIINWLEETLK